jgi:hypothetical protein
MGPANWWRPRKWLRLPFCSCSLPERLPFSPSPPATTGLDRSEVEESPASLARNPSALGFSRSGRRGVSPLLRGSHLVSQGTQWPDAGTIIAAPATKELSIAPKQQSPLRPWREIPARLPSLAVGAGEFHRFGGGPTWYRKGRKGPTPEPSLRPLRQKSSRSLRSRRVPCVPGEKSQRAWLLSQWAQGSFTASEGVPLGIARDARARRRNHHCGPCDSRRLSSAPRNLLERRARTSTNLSFSQFVYAQPQ